MGKEIVGKRDVEKVAVLLKVGVSVSAACELAGVDYEEFRKVLERRGDLRSMVERAKAEAELMAVKAILEAAKKDWRAAAWFLERRFPEYWSKRERLDVRQDGVPSALIVRFARQVEEVEAEVVKDGEE